MTKEYEEYLLSVAWKIKRKQAFAHYGKMCSKCKSKKNLQIHHLTYKNIFNEPMEDLMVLCKKHHEEAHGINVPAKTKKKKGKKKNKGPAFIPNKNKKAHRKKKESIKKAGKPKNFYPALDALIERKRAREAFRMRVVE